MRSQHLRLSVFLVAGGSRADLRNLIQDSLFTFDPFFFHDPSFGEKSSYDLLILQPRGKWDYLAENIMVQFCLHPPPSILTAPQAMKPY